MPQEFAAGPDLSSPMTKPKTMKIKLSRFGVAIFLAATLAITLPLSAYGQDNTPSQSQADPHMAWVECAIGAIIAGLVISVIVVGCKARKVCKKCQAQQTNSLGDWPENVINPHQPMSVVQRYALSPVLETQMLETGDYGAGMLYYTNGTQWLMLTEFQASSNMINWDTVARLEWRNDSAPPFKTMVTIFDATGTNILKRSITNCPVEGMDYAYDFSGTVLSTNMAYKFVRLAQP